MTPKVSVIVPTYNRAAFLPQTLRSILSQTSPVYEIVVVDDGSTDGTEAVLAEFKGAVKYIKIVNGGVCAARAVGLAHATGDWIAFCDSDDLWLPNKQAMQLELLSMEPSLEFIFGNIAIVQADRWSERTKLDSFPAGWGG